MASLIDPRQPGFDCRTALDCAHASTLAYVAEANPDEAATLARQWGLVMYKPLAAGPHFAIFVGAPDSLIVAFRGTSKRAHWRTNLNFLPKATPWGRVHRGFLAATHRLWPQLSHAIAAFSHEARPLSITGHSLGGALAVLTSAMLDHDRHGTVSSVMTFGQPAVGFDGFNEEFLRHLGPAYVRFVHDVDGVSDIPLPFSHIAPPRYFDITGRLWNDEPMWQLFVDHWKAPDKYGGLEGFKTHGMPHYLEALDGFITHTGVRPRDPLATAGG